MVDDFNRNDQGNSTNILNFIEYQATMNPLPLSRSLSAVRFTGNGRGKHIKHEKERRTFRKGEDGEAGPPRSTIAAIYSVRAGRAGCPLFSVTYIDNPARPRHGGPSRVPRRVCLVAQYLDGEARTHKGGPTGPAGPSLRETGASTLAPLPPSSVHLTSLLRNVRRPLGRPRG